MMPQLAGRHVLDHALAQRADGAISAHGELLLSEVCEHLHLPQDGAPHPYNRPLDPLQSLDRATRAAAIAAAI
jgi:hypothetical protein